MAGQVERLLAPLRNRIANMVARAVVALINDDKGMQTLQLSVLDGETRDACERLQEYGFTSHPHPNAEAAVVFVGGRRDHPLVVAVDDRRYRLKSLAEGEVAIYTDEGDSIVLGRGRTIKVTAGSKVTVTAPAVEVSGTVEASGTVAGSAFKVGGVQVVGPRAAAILPPSGGGTVDGGARTTIGQIITVLQAHGLIG